MDFLRKQISFAKINEIKDEIPSIASLAINAALSAKIDEVTGEIPSIFGLALTSALHIVENKMPNVWDLVKKTDYDTKTKDIEGKYFIVSGYNELTTK